MASLDYNFHCVASFMKTSWQPSSLSLWKLFCLCLYTMYNVLYYCTHLKTITKKSHFCLFKLFLTGGTGTRGWFILLICMGWPLKKNNQEHKRFNPVLCFINSNYNLQRLFTFDLSITKSQINLFQLCISSGKHNVIQTITTMVVDKTLTPSPWTAPANEYCWCICKQHWK